MANGKNLTENLKLRLDVETREALERLAAAGDRTLAAEIRRACRAHVDAAETAASLPSFVIESR